MAKPGPQHKAMEEAFSKRLRQLYPEPAHEYSEGSVVQPVGLKPDVYVRHPDGRQWAFEMVHHNSQAKHLLENHGRYAQAGIHDVWILWDDLRPQAGRRPSVDQGVMLDMLEPERHYPLTKPQRAILEMQTGNTRYLYAFTVDPMNAGREIVKTKLMQALAIGVDIYRFVGWAGQERYPATHDYVPIFELEFSPDGSFIIPDCESADTMWESLLAQFGLGTEQGVVPSEWLPRVEQLLLSPEGQKVISQKWIESLLKELDPKKIAEIASFAQSAPTVQALPPDSQVSQMNAARAFQDADAMQRMVEKVERIKRHIETLDYPGPLKDLLLTLIDSQQLAHVAGLMAWQDESEALRRTREEE